MNVTIQLQKLKQLGYFRSFEEKEEYYFVTCPFHGGGKERTPSLGINKERLKTRKGYVEEGFAHCFGCGYRARFTKFLADIYNVPEFEFIKQEYKQRIYEESRSIKVSLSRQEEKEEVKEVTIPLTDEGRAYLHGRKISDEVIELFDIVSTENGTVVFPLKDKKGKLLGIQRRSIRQKKFFNTENLDKLQYLYGLYQVKNKTCVKDVRIYVTESIIDALTLWSWGYRAVAIMGSKFSEYHLQELSKLPYEIVLALDNDEIGKMASKKIKDMCINRGIRISMLKWGNNIEKDVNELNKENFERIKEN